MLRRRLPELLALVVLLHAVAAGWYASQRPIDGDEGYYGLAARLVAEGRMPYTDFFYPQAPLLPYLYAPGAALIGAPQLPGLRAVSVLWSVLCLALAAWWLHRTHGERPGAALTALVLVACSPELLLWQTTVKTYAWNNLAALAATLALLRGREATRHGERWLLASGLLLGLGISARLLYAPLAAVCALWLLAGTDRSARSRRLGPWLAGLAVGLLPLALAAAQDPAAFWFNNVDYHRLRINPLAGEPLLTRWLIKLAGLARALYTSPGLLLLLALGAWGVWRQRRRTGPAPPDADAARLSLILAGVLAAVSLVPEPIHRQYFTATLPILLLPAAAAGLAELPGQTAGRLRLALACLAPVLAAVWLGAVRPDIDPAPQWRLDHYRRVSRLLAAMTPPDGVVFSLWSGYIGGSGRQPVPGMENHFAVSVSEQLDGLTRRRHRIAGRHEMAAALRKETPDAAVLGTWMHDLHHVLDNRQTQELLDVFTAHYGFFDEVAGIKLCKRLRELGPRPTP